MNWIRHRFLNIVMLFLLAVLAGAAPASALTLEDTRQDGSVVLVGEDWVLSEGQTQRGDVMVISGDATVETGATLVGDLVVISGDVVIQGTVKGDVNVISGDVVLGTGSFIAGDVNIVSGEVTQEPGAVVQGEIVRGDVNIPFVVPPLNNMNWGFTLTPPEPWSPRWLAELILSFVLRVFKALGFGVLSAALVALIVALWPDTIDRVGRALQESLFVSLGVGFVTAVAVFLGAGLLTITICLAPLAIALVLALMGVGLIGWAALSRMVGVRIWEALGLTRTSDVLPAAVGAFILVLFTQIPCLGVLFTITFGSAALGAAVLTFANGRQQGTIVQAP